MRNAYKGGKWMTKYIQALLIVACIVMMPVALLADTLNAICKGFMQAVEETNQ
jgi:uncharacterized membrane protein